MNIIVVNKISNRIKIKKMLNKIKYGLESKKIITILLISITFFISCNDDKKTTSSTASNTENKSSESAEVSASKASCMINGKPWVATGFGCGITKKVNLVTLNFINEEAGNKQQILLGGKYDTDYKVGKSFVYKKAELAGLNMNLYGYTITDKQNKDLKNYAITEGEVKLTVATESKATGTFSFTAQNRDDKTDVITVADGKFEIEMYTE